MQVALWQFPRADFADWCELVGSPQCADYDEYLTLLAAVQADQERQGQSVRRVTMTTASIFERKSNMTQREDMRQQNVTCREVAEAFGGIAVQTVGKIAAGTYPSMQSRQAQELVQFINGYLHPERYGF